jgi:hypothetical protein
MLSDCEDKWTLNKKNHPTPELEDCSLNDYIGYIKSVDRRLIKTGRRPPFGKILKITKEGVDWAAEWAIEYEYSRGHHRALSLNKY